MKMKNLISNIQSDEVWDSAKHSYADMLLEKYDSEEVRDFLFNEFKKTGDYYYCKLIKDKEQKYEK
tara:strand:- start:321 stop:518 length:198 start_codon:yes stop_codon:yes gene_type:complete